MIRRDRRLVATIRRLLPRRREQRAGAGDATRLDYLERDISEVRTRVNALFFAVLLVGIGDTVTRVVLS